MNKELKKRKQCEIGDSPADGKPMLCAVCKSADESVFMEITNCVLCKKCQDELSESFAYMFNQDREDYPEL